MLTPAHAAVNRAQLAPTDDAVIAFAVTTATSTDR
jgi:hypothetical protein